MKRQIFILSSLLCICGVQYATASDYIEESEPEIIPMATDNVEIDAGTYMAKSTDEIAVAQPCDDELIIPMESTQNLWTDDAIIKNSASTQAVILAPMESKHKKSFHKPKPALGLGYGAGDMQFNNAGFSLGDQTYYGETVYIINNFLSQQDGQSMDSWGYADMGTLTNSAYFMKKIVSSQVKCPFDTDSECAIWMRKPIVYETVAPRSTHLRTEIMNDIATAVEQNPNISANDRVMAPLLTRYRVLMRASQSCCTGGITYKLRKAGASQKQIYKFLADDVNFSGFGQRCMVMTDDMINGDNQYSKTPRLITEVKNNCLCKSKESLSALLAPFSQLYKQYPDFAGAPFEYSYTDGVGRPVKQSVNADVQIVLDQLKACP